MNVTQWMLSASARHLPPAEYIRQLVARLEQASFPVSRLVFTLRTMHPEVWLESVRWDADQGAHVLRRDHAFESEPLFQQSPVGRMYRGEPGFRHRLEEAPDPVSYPILAELHEAGFTDYLIAPLELAPGFFSYVSCSTRAPGGFSEADLALWDALQLPLAATVADMSTRTALSSLLTAYLGSHAAAYVQSGHFRRGDGEAINAVIWFSDLRGFTSFADTHGPAEVIERLNRYFDLVGSAVETRGGGILKFIGDGILAVFPVEEGTDGTGAAESALDTAREVLQQASEGSLELGIGLHLGKVTFGNVGTSHRLDFTVIGGPVNEAARVEALCKDIGVPLLVTEPVAELIRQDCLVSVGTHTLRGARSPKALFTLA